MTPKILFVDDEPQFKRLILQRFRKSIKKGLYELLFADDGLRALEFLGQDQTIVLLVTDINMPRMDGFSLIKEVRTFRPKLRTIVLSAYFDEANRRRAKQLGAVEFITKPIKFSLLATAIQENLQLQGG